MSLPTFVPTTESSPSSDGAGWVDRPEAEGGAEPLGDMRTNRRVILVQLYDQLIVGRVGSNPIASRLDVWVRRPQWGLARRTSCAV